MMKAVMAGRVVAAVAVASIAAIASCTALAATFDGQYIGTRIATNTGWIRGRLCPQGDLSPVTLEVENNNATLVYNRSAHLIFRGPVTAGGSVAIPGRNDFGARGMSLNGVIANGQFDGRTSGLACNAEMHLKRISAAVSKALALAEASAPDAPLLRSVSRDTETRVFSASEMKNYGGESARLGTFRPSNC
jgi:hypothetical protein